MLKLDLSVIIVKLSCFFWFYFKIFIQYLMISLLVIHKYEIRIASWDSLFEKQKYL